MRQLLCGMQIRRSGQGGGSQAQNAQEADPLHRTIEPKKEVDCLSKQGNRQVYLVGGAVIMLFAGIIYAWSILKAPFAAEFGWSQGALGLNFTITMSCFCIGGILGGIMVKRLPLWLIICGSAVMVCAGFWISGSIRTGGIWVLYLSYGALCGLGIGIIYNVVISAVMGWFPDKRATVSGVLMMVYGASSLVLGSITGILMERLGWRTAFYLLGGCILVVCVLGAFVVKMPPPPAKNLDASGKEGSNTGKADYTTSEMLRRSSFWRFYLFAIFMTSIGSCVISVAKDISMAVGASEMLAIMLTGVLSVCNGLGRILSGTLFDRAGRRKTMLTASVVGVFSSATLLLSTVFASQAILVIGIVVTGLSYGFMPPLSSGFVGQAYGEKNFPLNFSIANTMLLFASFSATVSGWLYGQTGGYVTVFVMLLVFSVAGSAIGLSIKKI